MAHLMSRRAGLCQRSEGSVREASVAWSAPGSGPRHMKQANWHCRTPWHAAAATGKSDTQSFDEDDADKGLNNELNSELSAILDPKRAERMRSHFDLVWKVTKGKARGGPEVCSCCQGSGERECEWCHGTGVLTIGDKIYSNLNQGKCPVCHEGYCKCEFCRGTGSRAQWLPPIPPLATPV
mmetsp:Transcript_3957/g.6533  ORF Transcript_3957/g.6533 Transcript_3957/m.6533 type:complete len:181 (-) Transcript_3957:1099-1641(-)